LRPRLGSTFLICVASALAAGASAAAVPGPASPELLGELVARAREQGLAQRREWRALLHYRPDRIGSGWTSLADDPGFFLSPRGARDPEAELEASLRALFGPEGDPPPGSDPPRCRFVERRRWLAEALALDPAAGSSDDCPRFQEWLAHFDPRSLTLVFPEAFMNNPASMFGHTLLRVDAVGAGPDADLLAWAINFFADTGGEGGAAYAVKGILGLYPGYFSIRPYYEKVKEYGDWEDRDLWEYELDFTREEILRVLRHLWELGGVRFDYWFFTENCSYQLLDLLEVGRPGLGLIEGRPLWLIPADSVRAAARRSGLFADVRWRPSAATQLRHAAGGLAPDEQELVLGIARGELAPDAEPLAALPEPRRAAVLTLAYDHLRHELLARRIDRDASRDLARRILVARSRVPLSLDPSAAIPTPAVRPDEGHATARFSAGAGVEDDAAYLELRLRPAFHDLLDPEGGYTRGAEIRFLDGALRWFPGDDRVRLHELIVLDIVSIAPRDRFFEPISWRFDTGLRTRLLPDGDGDLEAASVWRTRGGFGGAWELAGGLAYAMGEAVLEVGPDLDDEHAVGPGAALGWYAGSPGDRFKGHAFARVTRYVSGEESTHLSLGAEQRLTLGDDRALELRASWERDDDEDWLEAALAWHLYF
jgi:hypothetical protein